VPQTASAATAATAVSRAGAGGAPSVRAATGSAARAAPRNCTAVTATGSRPGSSRAWPTVNTAEISTEASTSALPPADDPVPCAPVTSPTPASDSANPAQATGLATVRCQTAAITATSTGAAPTRRAASLTLVPVMPMFCSSTEPP